MASEGFEAYHVPQQSRRDRLRGGGVSDCTTFYNDPSLLTTTTIPSDLLLLTHKQKSLHFMDPQISSSNSFQEINNPFLYSTHQNRLHFLDHHGVDMVHKQEHIYSSANDQPNMIINDNNNNNNDSNNSSSSNYVTTGQGLSLSLSSHNHHHHNQHQRSTTVPLELNLQRYDQSSSFTTVTAASCCNNNLSSKGSCSTILGPFTGYALILKGSRFLKPAEQLLEEICDAGNKGIYGEKLLEDDDDDDMMDPTTDATDDDASEHRSNKSKLISMLDEVYRRYKQYSQQLQGVVASFESVPGLGHAAPFANLSLKALSKHFRYLKNAISDQLNHTIKSHTHNHSSQINCDDSTTTRPVGKGSLNYNNFQRAAIQNAGIGEHQPVWRPQRGLPERAVTVLRAWLFDHFLHPYPTDSDKVMLAKQTGLSRNQVSNWFINARVRLWKPMVEEIHMLETRQAHKSDSQRQGQNNYNPVEYFPTSNDSLPSDQNRSTSAQQFPSKRTLSNDPADQMNLSYNFSPRSRVGVDQVMSAPSGGNGGVSLTLELHHQNNSGVGMGGLSSEPFPRNAARRFGIDASNEVLILGGGFEAQNHQLGRDHNNIIGGQWQLLHDFVG